MSRWDHIGNKIAVNVTARYVRMFGVTRATPYGLSLFEMEIYATAGIELVAPHQRRPGSAVFPQTGTKLLSSIT
jgi:hypothetical protein